MSRWLERPSALLRRALGLRPRRLLHVDGAATGAAAPVDWHATLQPLFAPLAPREEVDVVVADACCRFWLTTPDPSANDLPDLRASFFLFGPGVPAGRSLGQIDMRDIAATLARRLNLTLPTDGKSLLP